MGDVSSDEAMSKKDNDIKGYIQLLTSELYNNLHKSEMDLSNVISLENMGKVFSFARTKRDKGLIFRVIKKLDKQQFDIVFKNMFNAPPAILIELLFISPHLINEDDFVPVLSAMARAVPTKKLSSWHHHFNWKYGQRKLLVRIPIAAVYKLAPLARLKALRILSEMAIENVGTWQIDNYPFQEKIGAEDLNKLLFPMAFKYSSVIDMIIRKFYP